MLYKNNEIYNAIKSYTKITFFVLLTKLTLACCNTSLQKLLIVMPPSAKQA